MAEKAVAAAAADMDPGDGMHCPDHPFRQNPGGVCASCLQEKLGRLVMSSSDSPHHNPFRPAPPPPPCYRNSSSTSSSSSTPSSFRSARGMFLGGDGPPRPSGTARSRIPFLLPAGSYRKKKKSGGSGKDVASSGFSTAIRNSSSTSAGTTGTFLFSRSKSVAQRPGDAMDSPRRRSFWSFLSNRNHHHDLQRKGFMKQQQQQHQSPGLSSIRHSILKEDVVIAAPRRGPAAIPEEVDSPSPASASFGSKVARSRSVGCGSRSFSGDFLDRISTGLGDCALRRVESHREPDASGGKIMLHRVSTSAADGDARSGQLRIRCGGIFGGFGIMSSSSAAHWLAEELDGDGGGSHRGTPHARLKGWGWAFASPLRAFRPSTRAYGGVAIEKDVVVVPVECCGSAAGKRAVGVTAVDMCSGSSSSVVTTSNRSSSTSTGTAASGGDRNGAVSLVAM